MRDYIKFLQGHDEDYSDRYVYNIFQTLNTFPRANGILAARPLLAKLSFASKPVKPRTDEQLKDPFSASDNEETLVFYFFRVHPSTSKSTTLSSFICRSLCALGSRDGTLWWSWATKGRIPEGQISRR